MLTKLTTTLTLLGFVGFSIIANGGEAADAYTTHFSVSSPPLYWNQVETVSILMDAQIPLSGFRFGLEVTGATVLSVTMGPAVTSLNNGTGPEFGHITEHGPGQYSAAVLATFTGDDIPAGPSQQVVLVELRPVIGGASLVGVNFRGDLGGQTFQATYGNNSLFTEVVTSDAAIPTTAPPPAPPVGTIRAESSELVADHTNGVTIVLDNDVPVSGLSFGVTIAPAQMSSYTLSPEVMSLVSGGPEFLLVEQFGFSALTVRFVLDLASTVTLPVATGTPIMNLRVSPDAGASSVHVLTRDDLGTPPVPLIVATTDGHGHPVEGQLVILPVVPGATVGDANGDGSLNIADAIRILNMLSGGEPPECTGAFDVNADGSINIADAIYLLSYLNGSLPGVDLSAHAVGCDSL